MMFNITEHITDFIDIEQPSTKLIRAVNNEDLEKVKLLITPDVQVENVKDSNEDTLVHIAVRKNNFVLLEYLLNLNKIDINSFNTLGRTPLLLAVERPYPEIIKLLIRKGADVNLCDSECNTPLHHAGYCNFLENCLILLENGANVNAQNSSGHTLLHLVCTLHNDMEWLNMLLYYDADPMIFSWETGGRGCTPFDLTLIHNKNEYHNFLYPYVIDEVVKIPITMEALMEAMVCGNESFSKLIDNVTKVIFDVTDLDMFLERIFYFKSDYLKLFIEKFYYIIQTINENTYLNRDNRKCIMESLLSFIEHHTSNFLLNESKLIDNFYIIFSQPSVYYFIEDINESRTSDALSLLTCLLHSRKFTLEQINQMIYHLLSYGVILHAEDLNKIYHYFGDGELFRILLHMDIEKPLIDTPPLPTIIYSTDLTIEYFLYEKFDWLHDLDHRNLDRVIEFFTHPIIKEMCLNTKDNNLIAKIENLPKIPSLLQLARDQSRKYIINSFNIKNSRQFYTLIKKIHISDVYKAIISFQKKIYF